jgi:hypothetical protein
MSDQISPSRQQASVEQLLTSLAGIVSARIVTGIDGRLEEIHILATDELQPKQVVRNVESALSAGLGLRVDRRIISVAQLREDAVEVAVQELRAGGVEGEWDEMAPGEDRPLPEPDAEGRAPELERGAGQPGPVPTTASTRKGDEPMAGRPPRVEFVRHDIAVDSSRTVSCSVLFRLGEMELTGQGEGFDSPQGRAEAAARAVFDAFSTYRSADRLGLEGVAIVDAQGRDCVLVSARSLQGRRNPVLTGVAPIHDSTEEAAILAALQATNHWRVQS